MSIYGSSRKKTTSTTTAAGDVDLSEYVKKTGTRMTGRINMGDKKITNLADPTDEQDAATARYVSNYASHLNDIKLDKAGGTLTGEISMSGSKITNVEVPTENNDAATKAYVDSLVQHEHDVSLHNVGRYIVMPDEEDGTKTYFSVRAEKNVDLDLNKLVEVKAEGQNGEAFNDRIREIAISGVPIPTSPNDGKDLRVMRLSNPLEIFFNRNYISQPWNLSFSARPGSSSPRTYNAISLTFQTNPGYFSNLVVTWNNNGITYTVLNNARETIRETSFELDASKFNHISIEYVENKVCFWINGHQMDAMYRTQAFTSLVKIDVGVKELGILTFYDRNLRKSEIVQHFINNHVENFTNDIVLI